MSNGAYHVSAWAKSSELTAARSDEYYEARLVGPDELHFIFTANADEAWQLYEAGDIDYIAHLPDSVITELSQDESWKSTAVYATASVLYNNESDTFSNEHIRKAFDLAIDRTAVTKAAGAENRAATGLVPYGIPDAGETEDDFRTTGGAAVEEAHRIVIEGGDLLQGKLVIALFHAAFVFGLRHAAQHHVHAEHA